MAMASLGALIHMINLIAAAWFAQKAFKRLFKEVELAIPGKMRRAQPMQRVWKCQQAIEAV